MQPRKTSEDVRAYVLEESKTLAEIARRTGLPKSTLNPWLKGERHITTRAFDTICEVYDIYPIRAGGAPSENVMTVEQLGGDFSEGERAKYLKSVQVLNDSLRRTYAYMKTVQGCLDKISTEIGGDE